LVEPELVDGRYRLTDLGMRALEAAGEVIAT